ncbi:MAG: hypothetical protein ACSNEK_05340 [Parachlamydiaceae bacterium]
MKKVPVGTLNHENTHAGLSETSRDFHQLLTQHSIAKLDEDLSHIDFSTSLFIPAEEPSHLDFDYLKLLREP